MNYAQLGAKVKTRYPQYKDLADDELGKRIADKYPEYKAQITEEPQKNLLGQATDLLIPQTKKFAGQLMSIPGLYKEALTDPKSASEKAIQMNKDMMNTKNKAGFELSSYVIPFGNTAKARAGYGALSGGLLGASKDDANPLSVAGNALTSGILSPVMGAATDIGGQILQKTGGKIKDVGEELVLKGLKPTKSQLAKFKEKTGQDLAKWLTKNKITGNFVDEVTSRVDDLQTKFDDLAVRSGAKIKVKTLLDKFTKQIADMDESIIPSVKAKAQDLQEVFDNLQKKYGDAIDVSDLTKERRQIDKLLKEAQFGLPPEQASYLKAARDTLQESVQEATDGMGEKSLKQLGLELRDLYAFKKIADMQSGLGRGANVFGLLKTVATGAGGTIGGVPGAIAGYGAAALSQNPTALSAGSRMLQGVGQKIGEITTSKPYQMGLEALQRALRNTTASQLNRPRLP